MGEYVPFQLKLSGDTADFHQFQGYDGYMALAGFAWTLSLTTHYLETGEIRQRGDFLGRHAVRAKAPASGSVVVDLAVWLEQSPQVIFGLTGGAALASPLLVSLVQRIIARNLGQEAATNDALVNQLLAKRAGDIEHLVAINEAPIRQTHGVIGNGASVMDIVGGHNIIGQYNEETRDYVKLNVEDSKIITRDFTVSSFNVNSGYGSVFDNDLGRTIPISMSRDNLQKLVSVFTWGLDQYANKTGKKIVIKYSRILAMDGTPKRYIVDDAQRAA